MRRVSEHNPGMAQGLLTSGLELGAKNGEKSHSVHDRGQDLGPWVGVVSAAGVQKKHGAEEASIRNTNQMRTDLGGAGRSENLLLSEASCTVREDAVAIAAARASRVDCNAPGVGARVTCQRKRWFLSLSLNDQGSHTRTHGWAQQCELGIPGACFMWRTIYCIPLGLVSGGFIGLFGEMRNTGGAQGRA